MVTTQKTYPTILTRLIALLYWSIPPLLRGSGFKSRTSTQTIYIQGGTAMRVTNFAGAKLGAVICILSMLALLVTPSIARAQAPEIICPATIELTLDDIGENCIELLVTGADSVVAENASWNLDTLCFTASTPVSDTITVIATNASGADSCEVIIEFPGVTKKCGFIDQEIWTTNESPIAVMCSLTIAHLTIEEGVEVYFFNNSEMYVSGLLKALGTSVDSVVFSCKDTASGWQGIRFESSLVECVMEYCQISYSNNSGIRILDCSPTVQNCYIFSSYANQGGGLFISRTSLTDTLTIVGCEIVGNTSDTHAGGIKVIEAKGAVVFRDCNIFSNVANYDRGGSNYVGGGIYFSDNSEVGILELIDCSVVQNIVRSECYTNQCDRDSYGGGLYLAGNCTIQNCVIDGNVSRPAEHGSQGGTTERTRSYGGGIYIARGVHSISNSQIRSNVATCSGADAYTYGGGIYLNAGSLSMYNSIVSCNRCDPYYGYLHAYGGGIFVYTGTLYAENCSFVKNTHEALWNSGGSVSLTNTIAYFNGRSPQIRGTVSKEFCNIQDFDTTGTTNISQNPVFVGENCDVQDYALGSTSPCIDAGNSEVAYNDLCFPPSKSTARNDIGAYGGPGACGWISGPPNINCISEVNDIEICELGQVCISLQIMDAAEVQVNEGSWSEHTLCVSPASWGYKTYTIIATNQFGVDTCEVTINMMKNTPIEVDFDDLSFAMTDMDVIPPPAQTIEITSPCDAGALDWNAVVVDGADWLEITPASGTNPETMTASIAESALPMAAGIYNGLIAIYDDGASNSPVYVNVSLFVESGVLVGDYNPEPGTIFDVPIVLYTTDLLADFTLPLKLITTQPDKIWLEDITFDPIYIDTVFWINDSEIVYQPIQPPPIPDDTAITLGFAKINVAADAEPEEFYLDTTTVIIGAETYSYQFVKATGDTIVPSFDKGTFCLGCFDRWLDIAEVSCPQGDTVDVPIMAYGIENVGGLQLQIGYDPQILRTPDVFVISDYLTGVGTRNDSNAVIYVTDTNPDNPFTVPDSGILLTLRFIAIGDSGEVSPLTWMYDNVINDPDGVRLGYIEFKGGSVMPNDVPGMLSGGIDYYTLCKPVPDVQVTLTGADNDTYNTGLDGWYLFDDVVNGECTITPECDRDDPGLNIQDATIIMNQLVGRVEFSPYQLIAADVTLDCDISISDVVKILRDIAIIEDLPSGPWAFVDRAFAINTDNWCTAPDSITTTMSGPSQMDHHFLGIRMGDVNGDWCDQGGAFPKAQYVDGAQVSLSINELLPAEDGTISVPIKITNNGEIGGFEIHLDYDPERLSFINASTGSGSSLIANAESDKIHIAWVDVNNPIKPSESEVLVNLSFSTDDNGLDATSFTFDDIIAVNRDGQLYRVNVSDGEVDGSIAMPKRFSLSQNHPNPFNPITQINYSLAGESQVRIEVFNITGQRVKTLVDGHMEAGEHTIIWDSKDGNGDAVASGIYFYRIKTDQFTATKKMVLLK